ncbi:hypothetical protein [Pseudomonas sp. SJZ131]|uniref:hypothetical protein n=1 Tax=Pseudomonas sp. SJZ131 TaxID=2572895 RepID=UPI001199D276|nr:hypothetical protein [Pseudomonas sp. SJZ131]TWD47668.1 hypothetical protein FBY12_3383 [Pseudomonas sp. SJZ131]
MKDMIQHMVVGCSLAVIAGCSAIEKTDSFTLTADLPPNFAYVATVYYKPAVGQTCTVPAKENKADVFNREWRTEYQPNSQIKLYQTVNGCLLALSSIGLDINATYGKDRGDFGGDFGAILVGQRPNERYRGTFNASGESEFFGECQWLFRTIGPRRYITKLLDCRNTDAQDVPFGPKPLVTYTLDELAHKTVRLKIKLVEEEKPSIGDTWVKVPGGWKRCMGENFEDGYAFCYGNHKNFSTFRMPDGRSCTIYPGCTENLEAKP